jgi:hypothetical protein
LRQVKKDKFNTNISCLVQSTGHAAAWLPNRTSYTLLGNQQIKEIQMSQIKMSKFVPRQICVYSEIWNEKKLQLIPIKEMDNFDVCEVLDSIVIAVEAGVMDKFRWPQQIFANRNAFEEFVSRLSEYDECYRITDQWWRALAALCEIVDEESFVSSSEIASELLKSAHEDGKFENFGRKVPKYKHSVAECIEAQLTMAKFSGARYSDAVFPASERVKAQTVAYFGRFHAEQPSKAQLEAAYREGELLLKAHLAAEKATAKAAKTKKIGTKAAPKAKALVK